MLWAASNERYTTCVKHVIVSHPFCYHAICSLKRSNMNYPVRFCEKAVRLSWWLITCFDCKIRRMELEGWWRTSGFRQERRVWFHLQHQCQLASSSVPANPTRLNHHANNRHRRHSCYINTPSLSGLITCLRPSNRIPDHLGNQEIRFRWIRTYDGTIAPSSFRMQLNNVRIFFCLKIWNRWPTCPTLPFLPNW